MIHITVPDTQTLIEPETGRSYEAYNLHVNGAYHASARYSSLLRLHEKLQEIFGCDLRLAEFPAKKFRKLDKDAVNERRLGLAKYFQSLVQQSIVAQHHSTEWFFLSFQVESFRPSSSNVSVDVYLPDGSHETVRCNVQHPTETVLKRFAELLSIERDHVERFGLFIARRQGSCGDGQLVILDNEEAYPNLLCKFLNRLANGVRLLRNFESPYISLQLLNRKSVASGIVYRLVVRKLVWEPKVELTLFNDPGSVFLLYKQAVWELRNKKLNPSVTEKLMEAEQQNNCTQFLRLCHAEPSYGYETLEDCVSDYPSPGTHCHLKVGRRHIVLDCIESNVTEPKLRAVFRATRIRVWRLAQQADSDLDFIFQFEYLMSKDSFENITLKTRQAVLLSLIMQSFGAEILKEPKLATQVNRFSTEHPLPDPTVQEEMESSPIQSIVQKNSYNAGYHVLRSSTSESELEPIDRSSSKELNKDDEELTYTGSAEPVNDAKMSFSRNETDALKQLFIIISSNLPSDYGGRKITDNDL